MKAVFQPTLSKLYVQLFHYLLSFCWIINGQISLIVEQLALLLYNYNIYIEYICYFIKIFNFQGFLSNYYVVKPQYLKIKQLQEQFQNVQGVIDVHILHILDLRPVKTIIIAHVFSRKRQQTSVHKKLTDLSRKKRIYHSTFQVEQEELRQHGENILCDHDIHLITYQLNSQNQKKIIKLYSKLHSLTRNSIISFIKIEFYLHFVKKSIIWQLKQEIMYYMNLFL